MKNKVVKDENIKRHERLLPIADFDADPKYKENCISCPSYGMNLSCPPFSPLFSNYLIKAKTARVVCLRLPLDTLYHLPMEERARAGYERLSTLLTTELMEQKKEGYIVAGAGDCRACNECPLVDGKGTCIKPDEQIYSLESLGVNLSALIEKCFDFKLEWNERRHQARHVCAVGAIFYE